MAENKRYISLDQENGNVMISEDVIATIVDHTALEVDGVDGLHNRKSWGGKNIRINIAENNALYIECNLVVKYGYSIIDVAKNAQASVVSAVESMTGVKVTEANMNVCRISRQ